MAVVLKFFALVAHFAIFPNFVAHLDPSADLFWSALSFPLFPLPDAVWCTGGGLQIVAVAPFLIKRT